MFKDRYSSIEYIQRTIREDVKKKDKASYDKLPTFPKK